MFNQFGKISWRPLVTVLLTAVFVLTAVCSVTTAQDEVIPTPQPRLEIISQRPLADGSRAILVEAALVADEDTFIASSQPSLRFGAFSELAIGYDSENGAERSFLHFNLADDLPDEAKTILSGTLSVYNKSTTPSLDAPMVIDVRRVDGPWNEVLLNWNNAPGLGGSRGTLVVNRDTGFYEADITSLVEDWFSGARENHGIALLGDENAAALRERTLNSREASIVFRPRLFIEYVTFVDEDPPVVTVNPLPQYSPTNFTVSWSGSDVGEAGIDYYDVQYRKDGGSWTDWKTSTTATSATFDLGQVGGRYDFRARGVDNLGNVEAYGDAEATTIFGLNPPEATVLPLAAIQTTTWFNVQWQVVQPGSGITGFLLYYRTPGLSNTSWQSYSGSNPIPAGDRELTFVATADTVYEFEIVALSSGGLKEEAKNQAESATAVDAAAPFIEPLLYLPHVAR